MYGTSHFTVSKEHGTFALDMGAAHMSYLRAPVPQP